MAKLINDVYDFGGVKFLTESTQTNKNHKGPPMFIVNGIACVADQINGNNRRYPYELLKSEIERLDKEMIQTGRLLPALEHPDYPECRPEDACAKVLEVHEDGDSKTWIAKSCILASQPEYHICGTPKGDLLLSLLQYGTPIGYSSRSLGELNEDETEVVELKMMNLDLVLNPSTGLFCDSNGNRFVNGILESKQFVCNFHPLKENKYERFEKRISKMPNTYISEKKNAAVCAAVRDFLESFTK